MEVAELQGSELFRRLSFALSYMASLSARGQRSVHPPSIHARVDQTSAQSENTSVHFMWQTRATLWTKRDFISAFARPDQGVHPRSITNSGCGQRHGVQ